MLFFFLINILSAAAQEKPLAGKAMVVIGDSYVRNHRRPVEETWHARAAEQLGLSYRNYGRNGNCIAFDRSKRGFGKSMLERYHEMTDTADIVLVIAGHNDANIVLNSRDTLELFRQRLDSLCIGLRMKYPKAAIGFVTPWDIKLPGFPEVTQAIREACAKHDFQLLDAARTSGIHPMDSTFRQHYFQAANDRAHLNAQGHALLLDWGTSFLRTMADENAARITKQSQHTHDIFGSTVQWDRHSLIFNGRRVTAVMGEIHYSRLPEDEWADEIRKMKEGGVTIIANYVFWNHVEEHQGIFNWSGQRDLRRFIEICKQEGMPVCLRIGPFCHGEARNGGIPDWVVNSGCKLRSQDPQFLGYVETLYRQIFTQVDGLQWKDGGPVLACQFDNEYGGHGSYLMALKSIAQRIGFDLPFYTRTGWPELSTPVPFGEMIPLYGDYADGFWDRNTKETAGNYYKAFNFRSSPVSGAIGSEQLNYTQPLSTQPSAATYPYFTCELGGGMMTSYHRRCYLYPEDAYSMAVVKLGSGSNLLGYYMYHGGTNPISQCRPDDTDVKPYDGDRQVYLNESQRTSVTNYNDMPVLTYDFQAPLGEFGQINPHYYLLRKLHLFMADFGEELAPMEVTFTNQQDIKKGQDDFLRWSYRSKGDNAFVFVNNYERLQNLTAKAGVRFNVCGVQFPSKPITVPASTSCIFPVNMAGLRYATAQLVARRDGKIYLEQINGIPTELAFSEGKTLKNVKAQGLAKPVYTAKDGTAYYLLSSDAAGRLFLQESGSATTVNCQFTKTRDAGEQRTITIGAKNVAQEPLDCDFDNAAVYTITLPQDSSLFNLHTSLLQIHYQGDCARLYADGKLIADNFYNGRPFLYGLWRLPAGVKQLELRILPIQPNMPVYFPREADTMPGERVNSITIAKH